MNEFKSLVLQITNKCNYLCDHCYLSCGPYRTDIMSTDIIDKSLAKIGYKTETIVIQGGEPTLFLDTIKYITKECEKYNRDYGYPKEICLRTNCSWAISREKAIDRLKEFSEFGVTQIQMVGIDKYHAEFYRGIDLLELKSLSDQLNLFTSVEVINNVENTKKLGRAKKINELRYNNKCMLKKHCYKIDVHGDIKICDIGHTCYLGSILDTSIDDILEIEFINTLLNQGVEKLMQSYKLKVNKEIEINKFDDVCEVCHYITSEWKRNSDS